MAARDGFQQGPYGGPPPVTTNIPLSKVNSKGSNKGQAANGASEKAGLFHRPRPVRKASAGKRRETHELTVMGKVYDRIFNFSIVTRYLLFSFPLGALIAVPIVLGATVFGQPGHIETASGVPIVWVFTWIEAVWVSLWVSKIAAKCLPSIFEFLAGAISPGVKKYSLAIQRLEIPLSLVGWAVAALGTFIPIMQHHPNPQNQCPTGPNGQTANCGPNEDLGTLAPWTSITESILTALLVCSLLLLAEKTFVQFVSINYHAMQYDARIKESKRSVLLLGVLYDASRALFEPFCPEFAEEDYIINDSLKLPQHGGKASVGASQGISGSATPVRLLQNVGRLGDQLTAAFGRVAHEVTGKDVFNPTASHSIVLEALENKVSCEALARRIWMSLVVEGKDALFKEDVVEVLADRPAEEAAEAFHAVDRDSNGDVTLDEMVLTVCDIGRERKAVANSLHNIGSAINVLDNLLLLITAIASILVIVALLSSSFNTLLVSMGTGLLSVSFIFSSTAAEILNSCIFLFVKHPFDVDDRVDIADAQLVVERISLLYTVFRDVQTHKTTQAPNSTLNTMWIENVTRSKSMREQLKMYISFDTTLEDVELLRREMQKFVLDKDNCRDFESDVHVQVTGLQKMDSLELTVEIKHKSNWSNEMVRAARRSKFMCALVLALRRVPVNAPGGGSASLGSADAPTYSVAVSDDQAKAARKAFADSKAATHLKSDEGASSGLDRNTGSIRARDVPFAPPTETSALAILNTRSPAFDSMSPTTRNPTISPITESQEEALLRRSSTRGKRRESPGYNGQHDPVPGYLAAPPSAASGMPQPPAPSRGGAQPPQYGAPYPQGAPTARPQQPAQHLGYSGRSQSPAAGPRYDYPPAQQQQRKPPPPSRGGSFDQPPGRAPLRANGYDPASAVGPSQPPARGTPPRAVVPQQQQQQQQAPMPPQQAAVAQEFVNSSSFELQ